MICIPITAQSDKNALREIRRSCTLADFIELRMDLIGDGCLAELISAIRSNSDSVRVIVTCRKKEEAVPAVESAPGNASPERPLDERMAILEEAVKLGADYVDIELASGAQAIEKLQSRCEQYGGATKIIISYHNVEKTPSLTGLKKIFHQIMDRKPDVVKIVTMAMTPDDNSAVLSLIPYARKYSQKIIALCMGEEGRISRVASPLLGGFLSFAALERGTESAPGQLTAGRLRQINDLIDSSGRLRQMRACCGDGHQFQNYVLLGNPVGQSLSPVMHNAALVDLGIPGRYNAFCVSDLTAAVQGIRGMDIRGASVTIPFKVSVMNLLDDISDDAQMIGAVNTIVNDGGRLTGFNTDRLGLMIALRATMAVKGKRFAIIGAGGTARAAAYGIIEEGGMPIIVNRTASKGEKLARKFNCPFYRLEEVGKIKADCLINTTPVGMYPDVGKSPVDAGALAGYKYVMDVIYNPQKTKLLRDAQHWGCQVISGLDMFVHQGAEQLRLWTGKEPDRMLMKKVAEERLSCGR
jgi:shikimate dehydrogenase/3-dehydroquinate dehydratase type I